MIDLKLDALDHDLVVANYDLQLVSEIDQLAQKLTNRLSFYYGEWFLDVNQGVPYYDYVLVKNPDLILVSNLIKAAILDTTGVNSLTAYSQQFDSVNRKLTVDFSVDTIYGNLTLAVQP